MKARAKPASGTVVGKGRSSFHYKKLLLVFGVLLVIFVVAGLIVQREFFPANQCQGRSRSPLYNKAAAAIAEPGNEALSELTPKIKAEPGYEADPNCLLPVVIEEINSGDFAAAEPLFNQLKKIQPADQQFVKPYHEAGYISITDVQRQFNILRDNKEPRSGSVIYF